MFMQKNRSDSKSRSGSKTRSSSKQRSSKKMPVPVVTSHDNSQTSQSLPQKDVQKVVDGKLTPNRNSLGNFTESGVVNEMPNKLIQICCTICGNKLSEKCAECTKTDSKEECFTYPSACGHRFHWHCILRTKPTRCAFCGKEWKVKYDVHIVPDLHAEYLKEY